MGKLSKLAFLFCLLLFSVTGAGQETHATLSQPWIQGIEDENASGYFSEGRLNGFGLHSSGEHVFSTGSSFSAPDLHKQSPTFRARSFSAEARLQSYALQYLSYAKKIHLSLEVGDIIFPFHYFW